MNADKTDISNTNRVQESNARYYTSRGTTNWKANLQEIHVLKSKDLRGAKDQRYHETPNL
jgi:hypothetical protein